MGEPHDMDVDLSDARHIKEVAVNDLKAMMRRFVDEYQIGRRDEVADELLAVDFINHSAPPGLPPGREGVKVLFAMFWSAFPDLRAEIHDMLVEGTTVVTRKTLRGTHTGDFMGIAPTGRPVSIEIIDMVRAREGLFVEHWGVFDQLGVLQQLGVIEQ